MVPRKVNWRARALCGPTLSSLVRYRFGVDAELLHHEVHDRRLDFALVIDSADHSSEHFIRNVPAPTVLEFLPGIVPQECELIGSLFDNLGDRFARTMPRFGVDSDQNRVIATLRRL